MKLLLLTILIIFSFIGVKSGDVDTKSLFKDVKSDMLRNLIIQQLDKSIETFNLDLFSKINNDTKAAPNKVLAILGEKDLYSNKTLLKECIDKKIALVLININSEDKGELCSLIKTCSPNDDYFFIWLPSYKGNDEYSFSLYKNKKTEAPSHLSHSSTEPISHKQLDDDEKKIYFSFNNPFSELSEIIDNEKLFNIYKPTKNVENENENQKQNENEKQSKAIAAVEKKSFNDRSNTVFGGKQLASDNSKLKELIDKKTPVVLLNVNEKEKELFCSFVEGCVKGDSFYVAYVPYNNEESGKLEYFTIYDYLIDGSKNTVTFYQ